MCTHWHNEGGTPSKANNERDGYFVLICCPPLSLTFDQYFCKATAQYITIIYDCQCIFVL
jgi:hypothetical protein